MNGSENKLGIDNNQEQAGFVKKYFRATQKIKSNRELLKYEDLSQFVDMNNVKFENLDKLNQVETFCLLNENPISTWKLTMVGAFTVGYFGYMTYLGIKKGPSYLAAATKNKPKTLGTMISVGTRLTSKIFLGYIGSVLPLIYFSGLWNELSRNQRIKSRLANIVMINDDEFQKFLLMQALDYFEVSEKLKNETRAELGARREKLKRENASLEGIVSYLELAGTEDTKAKIKQKKADDDL